MQKEYSHIKHSLKPIIDESSQILILGSLPSVISRKEEFYYANKSNRFWQVISSIYQVKIPNNNDERLKFIKEHHLAFYDVIEECDIVLSSDSSIKNVIPADISTLIKNTNIRTIILTGNLSKILFYKYNQIPNVKVFALPSTSGANAKMNL